MRHGQKRMKKKYRYRLLLLYLLYCILIKIVLYIIDIVLFRGEMEKDFGISNFNIKCLKKSTIIKNLNFY